ncbi:hypothetical protein GCK72_023024 [Caenorhabditis remanei]|uniref:Uncharacterized protein n=1 Tax=Caenorhabditis remanei TaxID=31234 RepID=A0A6A5FVH1_CAERE|nr:hypothetical protein GCK72_023024 [Caenorhabditis remanei]KAF1746567.1 hypothetical protein GCK72_023024 [Caenorhabditis remanei]
MAPGNTSSQSNAPEPVPPTPSPPLVPTLTESERCDRKQKKDTTNQGPGKATSEEMENCNNGNIVGQKRKNDYDMIPAKKQNADNKNVGANVQQFFETHLSNRIGVFESVVYEPRRNLELLPSMYPSKPTSDNPKPNNEWFPVGNVKLNQELHMCSDDKAEIPSEYLICSSDMAVVKIQPTEYLKEVFNAKLARQKLPKNKKLAVPRKKNLEEQVESNDRDLDGRLIPTFTELFFPHGKTEIYDLMLRDFLATSGVRAGSYSAEFKSRVLTGFVARNYEYVFKNGLGDMFQKHIQLIGLNTPGWKKEHYDAPRNKYFELRAVWNNSQAEI